MKSFEYKNITIENIQNIIKFGYITEVIFDADNKEIIISDEEYALMEKAIQQTIKDVIEPVADAFVKTFEAIAEVAETFTKAIVELAESLTKGMSNKKISKKKFIKLLRSAGMQRNEINEIIKNNREKYTYLRYYNIISNFQKIKKR